jgi:hypothetical protein
MHDLEIDQTRALGLLVMDYVRHGGIAVRPRAARFIAPELMGAAIPRENKIYQIGAAFTENIATLDHHEPAAPALFRNCIDFNDSTNAVAVSDRPSGMKPSSSACPFPFFPIGTVFLNRTYCAGWLYPSLARANRFNR